MQSTKRFLAVLLSTSIVGLLLLAPLCAGAELTISGPVPSQMTPYPAEVYSMSDAQFSEWATEQNKKARAQWDNWYENKSRSRWTSYGTTVSYEQSRRGRYFGTNSERGSVKTYEKRYLNPDYTGRSLTIINPFCRPTEPQ